MLQDRIFEELRRTDLDDKVELVKEALKIAGEHGDAERLLRRVVRDAEAGVKQAAATEAVSSDAGVAGEVLTEAIERSSPKAKKTAVIRAVESTDTQRDAREIITGAMSVAPEATKDAVAKAVKNADSDEEAQEILTRAIHAAPAGTAEAAVKEARLSPGTLDQIWLTIVRTFAWVLGAATFGLVVVVVLDVFYTVDLAHVQIMLTMFTTVAGILAGFITGQAIGTAQERGRDQAGRGSGS